MSSVGNPEEVVTLDGTSIDAITDAILVDLEKGKKERINDLGLNYNYYFNHLINFLNKNTINTPAILANKS